MAQRIVHYLLGEALITQEIKDLNRFRVGNLLPDAFSDPSLRRRTHFIREMELPDFGRMRVCDFSTFHSRYEAEIRNDDLYLGYYMHLVEDAFCRDFWRKENLHIPKQDRYVRMLHQDYHILNQYFVSTRNLSFDVQKPDRFEEEKINEIIPFELTSFLKEFEQDFHDDTQGELTWLSAQMMERMIASALPVLMHAYHLIKEENRPLDQEQFSW